jgi:hypothetical protein
MRRSAYGIVLHKWSDDAWNSPYGVKFNCDRCKRARLTGHVPLNRPCQARGSPPPHPIRSAHKEVVKQSKVSSGTVSVIRGELRAVLPLCRNSESALCVAFASPKDENSSSADSQVPEFIGGADTSAEPVSRPFPANNRENFRNCRKKSASMPRMTQKSRAFRRKLP